jgi:3-hydroxy-9,10-secoandrosta-1,3,5(10)-triene-9,17-dione monooxygenase
MSGGTVMAGIAPIRISPSFSDVSHADAVQRARDLVPVLRERAARAEAARIVLPETLADLHHSGVLRALQPRRWGGMELSFEACFDVAYELGRGCASTSWTGVNLLIHHWMMGLWDEAAQQEVWGGDPEALIASGVATAQGKAWVVAGGFRVTGRWNFSSGVNVASWNMLGMTVQDGDEAGAQHLVVIPKSDYTIIDDWQVLGMRSTGSMTVEATDVFVPRHRALNVLDLRGGDSAPGTRTNPGALFKVAMSGFSGHIIASTLVGNAQAALEMAAETVRQKGSATGTQLRDTQAVQLRVSAAGARVDTARLLVRSEMAEAQAYAERGEVPDLERKLRAKRNVSYAVSLCTEAIDLLAALGGAHGIYDSNPLQRVFRDNRAGSMHIQFNQDMNYSTWGLTALGGEVKAPYL